MYDSKEIARRALLRADEIRERRSVLAMFRKAIAAFLGAGALLAAAMVIPTLMSSTPSHLLLEDDPAPMASFRQQDPGAKPYTGEGEGPAYMLPGYGNVMIPADTRDVAMMLLNPENNSCPFSFEIVLKDSGERLYVSGLLDPSMCIENIELTRGLEKGEYEAVLVIRAYGVEGLEVRQVASVEFRLIAE